MREIWGPLGRGLGDGMIEIGEKVIFEEESSNSWIVSH